MPHTNTSEEWSNSWSTFFQEKKTPFTEKYKRIFSIHEIENSRMLQWFFGAMLLAIFFTFSIWINRLSYSKEAFLRNEYLCWPYFLHHIFRIACAYSAFYGPKKLGKSSHDYDAFFCMAHFDDFCVVTKFHWKLLVL